MREFLRYYFSITDSSTSRRKTTLRLAIALVLCATVVFYYLDQKSEYHLPSWIYKLSIATSLISFFLVVYSVELAVGLFLLVLNFKFFLVMNSESFRTGFNFHMFTLGFLAMSIYGYRRRWVGIGFAVLSAVLAMASYIGLPSIVAFRNYTPAEEVVYFLVNGIIFAVSAPTLLFFTLNWNFEAEKILVEQMAMADDQNRQMLKTNEELDQFVYKTSHDLRAPLNEILQLANMAEQAQEYREFLFDRMKNQVVLMDEYIREIIDYSRNSRIEVRSVSLHMPTLIEEVWASLDTVPGFNSMEFSADVSQDRIMSDPDRLKTVMRNLAFNAIKYRDLSKPKSTIRITTGSTPHHYWIKVTDNGIGIDQQHQQKIFEMFYKGTELSKGSGLGLYMVKETVAKLGGSILLRSELGVGSEFTVKLPQSQNV
ncbi:MAG: sensor histidine kinase [Bacteroidota bacterium]|jgi:signal transduction histidine kinase